MCAQVHVLFETESRLHIKILDPNATNWELPASLLNVCSPPPFHHTPNSHTCASLQQTTVDPGPLNPEYELLITPSPFGFKVVRIQTGETIFDTNEGLTAFFFFFFFFVFFFFFLLNLFFLKKK